MFSSMHVAAQNPYDVDKIPAELLTNASVVLRLEQQTFDVRNASHATYTNKVVLTIVNKNGEDESAMREFYDKFSSISSLRASMYDAKGNKIKDYKLADFKDRSAISDGTIYDDGRLKELDFLNATYPYTIEYSYNKDYYGITSYPSWSPVGSFNYAVEKSEYVFKIPEGMTFKYIKSPGLKTDSVKVKGKTEYKWSTVNFKPLDYEPLSAGIKNVSPWVMLAPNDFEYDSSVGNLENWKNVGAWIYKLNSEPQILPPAVKTRVAALVSDAKTPKEKIKRLYNYLQGNTRYVSVQLGVGGFKPINADKVAAVNYGDCKALSNYMKALLNEVNIPSNLVVIGYDMPSMNPTFASLNQANHMILCVPLQKDTVWLECTSQHVPAGHLNGGCSDKNVLLVTADGGKLVRTPIYRPEDNFQKRKTTVAFNDEGVADINMLTSYGDGQYDDCYYMQFLEPFEQRKRVINGLNIPNLQLGTLKYDQPDKSVAVINESISLKCPKLLTSGADKLFLTLNLTNRKESVPAKVEERKTFFGVPYGYRDEDEIVYTIPKGYKVDFLPKEVVIESEFGKYTAKAVMKDNTVIYTRTQTMLGKKYAPEKYNSLVDFYKKVYQADKVKGVLAKVEQ